MGPINYNPHYYISFVSMQMHPKIRSAAAKIYGLLCGMTLEKKTKPYIKINQETIYKITGVHPNHQRNATKILEDWCFLKVRRNANLTVKYYEIFGINAQLFLAASHWYDQKVFANEMEYLSNKLPIQKIFNKNLVGELLENETDQDNLCLEKIKNQIEILQDKISIVSDENCTGIPTKMWELNNKDKDKNILKTQNVLRCVDSDAQTKPVLKRRTKVPQKQNLRDHLKNVPLSKPTANNPRRSVVDNYYNSRPFFQVMKLWNSLPNLKKISPLKEKQNKTLDNSVLAVKSLLTNSLLEKGMIDIDGRKQFVSFPQNFDKGTEKIDLHWLLEKIETFHDIITDQQAAPANKTPLTQMSLFDFILGKFIKQERYTSVLFQYCCGQRKTVHVDENPLMTEILVDNFKDYVHKNELTAKDIQLLSIVAARLINYRLESPSYKRNNKTKADITDSQKQTMAQKFFYGIELQWGGKIRTLGTSYFASDHAWNIYLENVSY